MKSEFEFLANIRKKYNLTKTGDDCAVMPKDAKTDLVITTDLLVEDIDFRLDWTRPDFLGHKALAVSLSDVAAMGAKPVWAMLSIGIPENIWKTDFVEKFYQGYMTFAKKFNIELIGGDVSKTPDKIVIDSIAAGEVKKGKAVLRSGAKAGDLIYVTGNLGGASAGLKLLENGIRYDESAKIWQKDLLQKQLQPLSKIWFQDFQNLHKIANSMIDLSDGLSSDLFHICKESKVGAKIFADQIPLHKNLRSVAKTSAEKLIYALNGGEDFELLFTADPKKISNKIFRHLHQIGEVTENVGKIELITGINSEFLEPKGFTHF